MPYQPGGIIILIRELHLTSRWSQPNSSLSGAGSDLWDRFHERALGGISMAKSADLSAELVASPITKDPESAPLHNCVILPTCRLCYPTGQARAVHLCCSTSNLA